MPGAGKLRSGLTGTRVERAHSGLIHARPEALGHVFRRQRLFGHALEPTDADGLAKVEKTLRNRLGHPLRGGPDRVNLGR